MPKGIFITFEGIDGAGKTTQIQKLAEALRNEGYDVTTLREPGGTVVSERIRELLLDVRNQGMQPITEAFLYASARAQMVDEILIPLLENGKIVLMDRFVDSTIAYQGYGRGLPIEFLMELNRLATRGMEPGLTILLDLDPAEAGGRMTAAGGAPDRIEQEGIIFQQKVRQGYLDFAAARKRFVVIPAAQSFEVVFREVHRAVLRFIKGADTDGQD